MDRLKTIESFISIVRHRSFSKAARDLGVTRALMSKRMTELEALLGIRLLTRNTQRVSLTEAGEKYFTACQDILAELESVEVSLTEQSRVARGTVRLLVSKSFGILHMGSAIAEFMTSNPGIHVAMSVRDMGQQCLDLVGEGFDVAIRTSGLRDSSLVARKIVPLTWLAVASPNYIKRFGQPTTPRELTQHNCIYPGGANAQNWEFKGKHSIETVKLLSGTLRSNLTLAIRDAAVAGVGIGIVPKYAIVSELVERKLLPLLPQYKLEPRALLAVYQKDRNLPFRLRLLLDFLTERFKQQRW